MSSPSENGKRRWRRGLLIELAVAAVAVVVVGVAWGDNVQNDVTADVNNDKIVTITAGGSGASVGYRIAANSGDGESGCNATAVSPAVVTPTGLPANVSKAPASLSITACSSTYASITFSASAAATPGDYAIGATVSDSGTGTYNTAPAGFTLRVLPAVVVDTAPSVSSTAPADNATEVARDANIDLTFSEAVNVTGSWFGISCVTSGAHTASVSGGPTTFTLDPDGDFVKNEVCTVTVYAANVTDQDGTDPPDTMLANYSFSFTTVVNIPPTAEANGPYAGNEGGEITFSSAGSSDSDGSISSYSWSVVPATSGSNQPDAGASCSFVAPTTNASQTPKVECTDDGDYDVTLTVTDDDGATDDDATTLTLDNVAPVIGTVTPADGSLYAVNTAVSVSAAFTDAGSNDTHTCTVNWGDGTTVGPTTTTTPCTSGHPYTAAGLYTVTLVVTDDDDDSDSHTFLVVVYDPSAGFVTGGGWIDSPAGAYVADANLTGKATFGFVSRYRKGATEPDGNTEFQFHAGDLTFKSTSYQWLVVSGGKATFKGVGTVNGAGNYGFLLAAVDGAPDRFRIKIWDKDNADTVVYDNNLGGADDAAPATALGGGSIIIHVPKK